VTAAARAGDSFAPVSSATATPARKRILFVAEAATLAHVARPLALARALDPVRFQVCIACSPAHRGLITSQGIDFRPLQSVDSATFVRRLAKGHPLYSSAELERYVGDDLQVIGDFRPDVVVGDFRLSLSVSARLSAVPYAAVTNAYWSPYARHQRFPVPELPVTRLLGVAAAQRVFDLIRPAAFARHALPLNRVRRRHGLPGLGWRLLPTYTDADCTLYADLPTLIPIAGAPSTHQYIGPVLWSFPAPLPPWWKDLPRDRPVVYVTLGSSGAANLLPRVLQALGSLPVEVVASTAGRVDIPSPPANCHLADYLPGAEASTRASLVICNGGSLTTYQALAAGVPVLGIASNMDQLMNMAHVARAGVGLLLRAGEATGRCLAEAATALTTGAAARDAARRLAEPIRRWDPAHELTVLLDAL
jgi:UDP:flavonoid glycosyltransferase YjiC (YdhE family)